jgi:hypothetical protein
LIVVDTFMRDHHLWAKCKCVCGTITEASANALRTGNKKSCGCLKIRLVKERATTHGEAATRSYEYRVWRGVKLRCRDLSNLKYGGRGIRICAEWENSFPAFLAAVGRAPSLLHTIGRINNNGNYEPGNVQWETVEQQAANKRTTRFIEYNGKRQALCLWARELGLNYHMLLYRFQNGWTPEQAFTIPSGDPSLRRRPRGTRTGVAA